MSQIGAVCEADRIKKKNHWQPGKEMFMEVAEQSGKTAPKMSPLT